MQVDPSGDIETLVAAAEMFQRNLRARFSVVRIVAECLVDLGEQGSVPSVAGIIAYIPEP